MIASFTASNQIGEAMKEKNAQLGIEIKKKKRDRPESGYSTDSEI